MLAADNIVWNPLDIEVWPLMTTKQCLIIYLECYSPRATEIQGKTLHIQNGPNGFQERLAFTIKIGNNMSSEESRCFISVFDAQFELNNTPPLLAPKDCNGPQSSLQGLHSTAHS